MNYKVHHKAEDVREYLDLVVWCNNRAGLLGWENWDDDWCFESEEIAVEFALKWT
jgi:hypothetical protein